MPPEKAGDVSVDRDASERDLGRTQREMSGELMISSLRARRPNLVVGVTNLHRLALLSLALFSSSRA
jgi:hypothetical protein